MHKIKDAPELQAVWYGAIVFGFYWLIIREKLSALSFNRATPVTVFNWAIDDTMWMCLLFQINQ